MKLAAEFQSVTRDHLRERFAEIERVVPLEGVGDRNAEPLWRNEQLGVDGRTGRVLQIPRLQKRLQPKRRQGRSRASEALRGSRNRWCNPNGPCGDGTGPRGARG